MEAKYTRHHRDDAQGHIFLDKRGPCNISLEGAAAMSQEELDFYGEIMAKALSNMSAPQLKRVRGFKPRGA